jgi:hypothetical protein
MTARSTTLLAVVGFAAVVGCSRRSSLVVRDGAVEGTTDSGMSVAGSGGVTVGTGGLPGSGGRSGTGGWSGTGGLVGSGGWLSTGGLVGSGGWSGTGGLVGSGGSLTSGGAGGGGAGGGGAGGGGAGGTTDCLGPSPLGAGVGGGACEGGVRCINVKSATLGYETCGWLVTKGRASVFEAVRACFAQDPNFCTLQPASVEACTGSVFARACAGPGATVDGVKVDCRSLAADCATVSENECHLMTDVLNDKYYQLAFECYFRLNPRPTNCSAALRTCTGAPALGTGGTTQPPPGSGGAGGTYDGGTQPACPTLAGAWRVAASCRGPGAFFNGSFAAIMTQAGCRTTFTQTDDQTQTQWVATGTIDGAGKGSLVGDFGFTDSGMCDLEAGSEAWVGRCASATQTCELKAEKQPP